MNFFRFRFCAKRNNNQVKIKTCIIPVSLFLYDAIKNGFKYSIFSNEISLLNEDLEYPLKADFLFEINSNFGDLLNDYHYLHFFKNFISYNENHKRRYFNFECFKDIHSSTFFNCLLIVSA